MYFIRLICFIISLGSIPPVIPILFINKLFCDYVSVRSNLIQNITFIRKYKNQLCWWYITQWTKLIGTMDFIEKFRHIIFWYLVYNETFIYRSECYHTTVTISLESILSKVVQGLSFIAIPKWDGLIFLSLLKNHVLIMDQVFN